MSGKFKYVFSTEVWVIKMVQDKATNSSVKASHLDSVIGSYKLILTKLKEINPVFTVV